MNRRSFLEMFLLSFSLSIFSSSSFADAGGVILRLKSELMKYDACSKQYASLRSTISRLEKTIKPGYGKTVVVDIPSQTLTAYENGEAVFSSLVVVGDPDWKTPNIESFLSNVRFNPTWTVPESIVSIRNWRQKVLEDPDYFSNLNFKLVADGRSYEPSDVDESIAKKAFFVQSPGSDNALGRIRIGMNIGESVYLHDTNDKSAFEEDDRSSSHGCIRVEKINDLASWVLGADHHEIEGYISSGHLQNVKIVNKIRIVTTYFTAWPDADGSIVYYDDVYNRDSCG